MIGTMLKPFFKKFIGLFFSMVFVSMLSIALLSAFASTIYNLKETFKSYLSEYQDVDSVVDIGFTEKTEMADLITIPGLESVEYRVTMDSFLQKDSGRTITSGCACAACPSRRLAFSKFSRGIPNAASIWINDTFISSLLKLTLTTHDLRLTTMTARCAVLRL